MEMAETNAQRLSHSHQHHHHQVHSEINNPEKNLLFSIFLNLAVSIAEVVGGLISNSLALISDALHNLGDTSALFIAYLANLISKRNNTSHKTFGYKRIEILAALFNAIILVVIVIFLFLRLITGSGILNQLKPWLCSLLLYSDF